MQARTKKELYRLAKQYDVPGRSRMDKAALIAALRVVQRGGSKTVIVFQPALWFDPGRATSPGTGRKTASGLQQLPRRAIQQQLPKLVAWYRRQAKIIAAHHGVSVSVFGGTGKIYMEVRHTGESNVDKLNRVLDTLVDPDEDVNEPFISGGRAFMVMPAQYGNTVGSAKYKVVDRVPGRAKGGR